MEDENTERLDAFLARELPQGDVVALEAQIRADDSLREAFIEQSRMDAALSSLMQEQQGVQAFAEGVMASVQARPERSLAKSVLSEILDEREASLRGHQPKRFDWWVWSKTAAIAAVAAAVTVWILQSVQMDSGQEGRAAPTPKFLARLSAGDGAVWGEDSLQAREDGWLGAGRLDLRSGLAEVTFGSGARVMLEGPAVFDLEQMNRGFLKRGRLTAEVPLPASGFVINTPLMNVIDIGTRFGLTVKNSGVSEVHVMQGLVEVSRTRGRAVPIVLREGLAVLADRRPQSRLKPIVYAGHDYVLPEQEASILATSDYLHYGFDEVGGAEIDDTGLGMAGGPFDISLLSESESGDVVRASPKRTAGVVGRALAFDKGQRLKVNSPDLLAGGTRPWSMALWIKIQAKTSEDGEQAMISWGKEEAIWKLGWNKAVGAGVEGALRADFGSGHVVAATDLRDGRWHHVAIVFIGDEGYGASAVGNSARDLVDVSTHVRLYVDGRLEALSGARSNTVLSVEGGSSVDASQFYLGGAAGFEGWLDEFYLLEGAAPSSAVLELYELALP
ncbi:MAG: hypothetical protein L3J39_14120 [Verrucomicrobiales bacterium]|nr:hypothetical protein [Verrucomicrobiales bacterium]